MGGGALLIDCQDFVCRRNIKNIEGKKFLYFRDVCMFFAVFIESKSAV